MIDVNVIPSAITKLVSEGIHPGKIITSEWIESSLGLNKDSKDYVWKRLQRFEEFRSRLLVDYKVDLKNIRGQGYMVVAPEDQTRIAMDDTVRGIGKAIQKGQSRVANVDIAKLSDESRKENADAMARLAGLGSMARKQIEG